jgi:hypothetical protein
LQFVERVVENYPDLFSVADGGNEDFGGGFSQQWGWYQSIYTVAGGNAFELERATALDIYTFLTFLDFKIALAKEETKQNKSYE